MLSLVCGDRAHGAILCRRLKIVLASSCRLCCLTHLFLFLGSELPSGRHGLFCCRRPWSAPSWHVTHTIHATAATASNVPRFDVPSASSQHCGRHQSRAFLLPQRSDPQPLGVLSFRSSPLNRPRYARRSWRATTRGWGLTAWRRCVLDKW